MPGRRVSRNTGTLWRPVIADLWRRPSLQREKEEKKIKIKIRNKPKNCNPPHAIPPRTLMRSESICPTNAIVAFFPRAGSMAGSFASAPGWLSWYWRVGVWRSRQRVGGQVAVLVLGARRPSLSSQVDRDFGVRRFYVSVLEIRNRPGVFLVAMATDRSGRRRWRWR